MHARAYTHHRKVPVQLSLYLRCMHCTYLFAARQLMYTLLSCSSYSAHQRRVEVLASHGVPSPAASRGSAHLASFVHKPRTPYSFFLACYGFEGFAKTAAESGTNVSDRALPATCEIKRGQYSTDLANIADNNNFAASLEPVSRSDGGRNLYTSIMGQKFLHCCRV